MQTAPCIFACDPTKLEHDYTPAMHPHVKSPTTASHNNIQAHALLPNTNPLALVLILIARLPELGLHGLGLSLQFVQCRLENLYGLCASVHCLDLDLHVEHQRVRHLVPRKAHSRILKHLPISHLHSHSQQNNKSQMALPQYPTTENDDSQSDQITHGVVLLLQNKSTTIGALGIRSINDLHRLLLLLPPPRQESQRCIAHLVYQTSSTSYQYNILFIYARDFISSFQDVRCQHHFRFII
jgi:hypothetical protein